MHLTRCPIVALLPLAIIAMLLLPGLVPSLKLFFLVPIIIIAYYQFSYVGCLWISMGSGILVDILSVNSFFGVNAFVYCTATMLLYPWRRYFFADRASTLPLMTILFSVISTVIFIASASLFQSKRIISWPLIGSDLIIMPICDGLYAYLCFILPFQLYKEFKRKRRRSSY